MAHAETTLRQLLIKIAAEQKYDNPEIIIKETTSGGANYTSKLFIVIIKEANKKDLHLFAKVATFGEKIRGDGSIMVFDTERFAYTKLAKIYESLEEENGVPKEHRLHFTKCYGFDPRPYKETVVMENLFAQGYRPNDRLNSFDWDYASATITNLAKMHALSFAFSHTYPEEFEKTLAILKMDWKEGSMDDMMKVSVQTALKNVNPEHKAALKKYLAQEVYQKDFFVKLCAPVRATVIIHADFRGSNLLHRMQKDGKLDIKIVDLQTLQGGSPVTDLIYFIFTGSDEQFRAKYYDKLIDHYYTQLSAAMRRLNLDPENTFSREDFDFELKEKLPFGLTLAVFTLPVITVDSQDAPEVNEDLEISNFAVEKTSELYAERLNGVVNDYVKWGILDHCVEQMEEARRSRV